MKKLFLLVVLAVVSMSASAQFEQKKMYVSTSLSGLNMACDESGDFTCGIQALGGYFVADRLMVYGQFGYSHIMDTNFVDIGAGVRYHFKKSGFYLGGGLNLSATENEEDIALASEVGYTYFLNRYLTIEPALNCNLSLNGNSGVGLKLGLGYYF